MPQTRRQRLARFGATLDQGIVEAATLRGEGEVVVHELAPLHDLKRSTTNVLVCQSKFERERINLKVILVETKRMVKPKVYKGNF